MGALKVLQVPESAFAREVPSFLEFSPKHIPWQHRALWDVFKLPYQLPGEKGDLELVTREFLFSGSVGSAKSVLLAHIIVKHCLMYKRAKVGIGRESSKDLRDTLYQIILDHMDGSLEEGKDYKINGKGHIIFRNKSRIIPYSWHDKRYKKFRSHAFSLFVIEELTENKERKFYDEIRMRLGRIRGIPFSAMICATNPDDPAHWAYDYFIKGRETNPLIHVYYSITSQNPFLNPSYVRGLQATLDPKMALRMLKGKWLSITTDKIYYAYDDEKNVIENYEVDPGLPVGMCWDFNIGVGKPMSMALFQHDPRTGRFYFFEEFIIEGSRTKDVLEELAARGYLDKGWTWEVFGDSSMKNNDTRSIKTDYQIIKDFLSNYETPPIIVNDKPQEGLPIKYTMRVPTTGNPPIRTRHNFMNGALLNDLGERSLFVVRKCTTMRKGLQLTALKVGAEYIEDDSKPYQHVTTAMGYAVVKTRKDQAKTGTLVTTY
jgi:hypothetical protein